MTLARKPQRCGPFVQPPLTFARHQRIATQSSMHTHPCPQHTARATPKRSSITPQTRRSDFGDPPVGSIVEGMSVNDLIVDYGHSSGVQQPVVGHSPHRTRSNDLSPAASGPEVPLPTARSAAIAALGVQQPHVREHPSRSVIVGVVTIDRQATAASERPLSTVCRCCRRDGHLLSLLHRIRAVLNGHAVALMGVRNPVDQLSSSFGKSAARRTSSIA